MFTNWKKCCFHQEKFSFLGYVVSSQEICLEEKKINAIKAWHKPKSVKDIQVFIKFANFYQHFIQGISQIITSLNLMLKTSPQPAGALLATSADNSKIVANSSKNDVKSTKSNFTNPVHRVEEPSFLTYDAR